MSKVETITLTLALLLVNFYKNKDTLIKNKGWRFLNLTGRKSESGGLCESEKREIV